MHPAALLDQEHEKVHDGLYYLIDCYWREFLNGLGRAGGRGMSPRSNKIMLAVKRSLGHSFDLTNEHPLVT